MAKNSILFTLLALLVAFYQNCSMSSHVEYASSTLFSVGSECDDVTKQAFQQTYYASFRSKCASCHAPGGTGNGFFASGDFAEAASSFVSMGRSRIESNFVSAGHRPPFTGPANQPIVDGSQAIWAAADTAYNKCMTDKNQAGGVITTTKTAPTIYTAAAGTFVNMQWNLTNDVAPVLQGKIPATISIDIRRAIVSGSVVGYEFRNPTARLNSASAAQVRLKGMRIVLNDIVLNDVTTYSLLDYLVGSTTNVVMVTGAFGLSVTPIVNSDRFAIRFDEVVTDLGPIVTPAPG